MVICSLCVASLAWGQSEPVVVLISRSLLKMSNNPSCILSATDSETLIPSDADWENAVPMVWEYEHLVVVCPRRLSQTRITSYPSSGSQLMGSWIQRHLYDAGPGA